MTRGLVRARGLMLLTSRRVQRTFWKVLTVGCEVQLEREMRVEESVSSDAMPRKAAAGTGHVRNSNAGPIVGTETRRRA